MYLEVWQQPVTAVEDDELREVALGGPDTSVRLRTMRRVRVLPNVGTESCSTGWNAVTTSPRSRPRTTSAERRHVAGRVPAEHALGHRSVQPVRAVGLSRRREPGDPRRDRQRTATRSSGASTTPRRCTGSGHHRLVGAQVIHFLQPPKDEAHWPLAQQMVELLPWSAVLPNGEKVADRAAGSWPRWPGLRPELPDHQGARRRVPANFGNTWTTRADAASLGTARPRSSTCGSGIGAETSVRARDPLRANTPLELSGHRASRHHDRHDVSTRRLLDHRSAAGEPGRSGALGARGRPAGRGHPPASTRRSG